MEVIVEDGAADKASVAGSCQSSAEGPGGTPSGSKIGRWQFSLRGLMLFVLLAAMGMSLFATGCRLRRAERELEQYRREYGILNVDNPAMLSAVARWMPDVGQWRWQVHFPPGRYDVCYATKGIPPSGFPKSAGGFTRDFSGDVNVSAALLKDPKSGKWVCNFVIGPASGSRDVPDCVVNPVTWTTDGVLWNKEPAAVSPQTPLVLLRRRIGIQQKDGSLPIPPSANGLLIWIRRAGCANRRGRRNVVIWPSGTARSLPAISYYLSAFTDQLSAGRTGI